MNTQSDKELFEFLANAPKEFREGERIRKFQLKNGDYIHCVLWNMHFFITGTDIVKILVWRFQNAGRTLTSLKKFEEGVFSDLRNLKPGIDATLEGPRSEFLEFLYKNGCIRTQKKQKVFYWYSVPHDALFCDALERDLRRETNLFTYNKYISNLARTNMMPHGGPNFGGHTRQNSKRMGGEVDPRYLRTVEPVTQPSGYNPRVQFQDADMFFDQKAIKKQPTGIHTRPRSNFYDKQFEEIKKSNLINPQMNYRGYNIKDKLFSPSEDQLFDYNYRRPDDVFGSSPFNNDIMEKTSSAIKTSSIQKSEASSSFLDEIPGGFTFDDFDFLKKKTESQSNEVIKEKHEKDEDQHLTQEGVSLMPNTRGTLQK